MKPLISVLIVEPSTIIIEGLKALLDEAGGFNILAPLHDASSLSTCLASQSPDLIILNPTLLPQPLNPQLSALQKLCPQTPIVALLYQYLPANSLQGFAAVIDICENRSRLLGTLLECCNRKQDDDEGEDYELTDREIDVLVLLSQGLSSKQIADKLNISIHTVNTHRKNITHKTGIKSVAGLTVYATLHNFSS